MEPAELHDDLRQELFLVLCEMNEVRLIGLHERGQLRWFMVGVIRNMMKSDRSTFYRTHRKFSESANELRPDIDRADSAHVHTFDFTRVLDQTISDLDEYEAGMIRLYSDMGHNCEAIATATGIPGKSVRNVISRAKQKLRAKLKEHAGH